MRPSPTGYLSHTGWGLALLGKAQRRSNCSPRMITATGATPQVRGRVLQDDCKVVRLLSYRLEKVGLQTLEPWIPAFAGMTGWGRIPLRGKTLQSSCRVLRPYGTRRGREIPDTIALLELAKPFLIIWWICYIRAGNGWPPKWPDPRPLSTILPSRRGRMASALTIPPKGLAPTGYPRSSLTAGAYVRR